MKKQQIIIGEKIKAILLPENGKKVLSFVYQEKTKDHIDLVITWTNHDCFLSSKKLLFDLEVKVECVKGYDVCLISLSQITRQAIGKIISYYKQNCREEKIHDSRIQEILEKIEIAQKSNDDNHHLIIKASKKLQPEFAENNEVDLEQTERILFPEAEAAAEVKQEIGKEEFSPNPKTSVSKKVKKKEKSILIKGKKKQKFLLSSFFSRLVTFEKDLDSPTMENFSKLFTFEIKGNLQVVFCRDDFVAINFEKAAIWYVGNNYNIPPVITRDGNKITIDFSSSEKNKKEERTTNGSFCFTPNEGSTVGDMIKRLHRINYLTRPTVEKVGNYFKVKYPSTRGILSINESIVNMGWNSKVESNFLLIFTCLTTPNSKDELVVLVEKQSHQEPILVAKVSEIVSVSNDKAISSPVDFTMVKNEYFVFKNKEEVLEKLKRIYTDPVLYAELSEETKNDIFEVLEEDWRRNHIEEYAKALLEFLKK